MAHILIDGYNLIGVAHKDLEKARNRLIEKLARYTGLKGHDITLVFDGWKNGQGTETRTRVSSITIVYSRIGENADFVIKRIVNEDKKQWIVVSSDREIADFAHGKDLVCISSDEFESRLNSGLAFSGGEGKEEVLMYDSEEDYDRMPVHRKGNPRKLSKRQQKKLHVLKKL